MISLAPVLLMTAEVQELKQKSTTDIGVERRQERWGMYDVLEIASAFDNDLHGHRNGLTKTASQSFLFYEGGGCRGGQSLKCFTHSARLLFLLISCSQS